MSIFLVISYTIINLSRWSEGCTGFRGLLCLGGILSIGMAIICSFGICSALGLFYRREHGLHSVSSPVVWNMMPFQQF